MYIVLDTVTRNALGEFETEDEAEARFFELVSSHPPAACDLKILLRQGEGYKKHAIPKRKLEEAIKQKSEEGLPSPVKALFSPVP